MYFLRPQGQAETKYPEFRGGGGKKKGRLAARIRIIYSGGTKWRWGHVRNRYQNTTWSHPPKKTKNKALKDLWLSHFRRQRHCGGQTNRRKERFWHCIASALLFHFLLCLTMRISLQHRLSCFRKFLHLIHCTKISIFHKLSQPMFHLLFFSPRVWNILRWQRLGLHTFFPHLLTSNDHISETEGSADSDEWRQRIKTCFYTTKPWQNKGSPAFKTAQLATAFKSTLLCHSFQKYIACRSFQPATLTCDSPGASMPYTQINQLWNSFVVRNCVSCYTHFFEVLPCITFKPRNYKKGWGEKKGNGIN